MIKIFLAFIVCCAAAAARAELASPWAQSTKSAARLIADEGLRGIFYHAGVEIRLDPNTITYWRNPGEAGVPPVFDFSGSTNVADAIPQYPFPKRIAEAGGVEAFGYDTDVIFPVLVTPANPALPVQLELKLRYAACEKICVPAEAMGSLVLSPAISGQASGTRLNAAEALVATIVMSTDVARVEASNKVGKLVWPVPRLAGMRDVIDVFAEPPEGWYFDTRKGEKPGEFEIVLAEAPKSTQDASVNVALTIVAKGHSGGFVVTLLLPQN